MLLRPQAPARRSGGPAGCPEGTASAQEGRWRSVGSCAASAGGGDRAGIGRRCYRTGLKEALRTVAPAGPHRARSESKSGAWMPTTIALPMGDRPLRGRAACVPAAAATGNGDDRTRTNVQARGKSQGRASPLSDTNHPTPYLVQNGETLTSIAKKSKTSVRILADANGIANVDLLLAGQLLLIPAESDILERPASQAVEDDEFPISRGVNWHHLSEQASQQVERRLGSAHRAPGLNVAMLAVTILLLAPLLGFCIRGMVDALNFSGERPETKQQQETEESEVLRRPKSQRWQKILEEDRDGVEVPSSVSEARSSSAEEPVAAQRVWGGNDVWSQDSNVRETTLNVDTFEENRSSLINPLWQGNNQAETDEEVSLRHKQDYEEIRNSYAELESSYAQFLADSGMSKSGYWRGSAVPTAARLDDGEPR